MAYIKVTPSRRDRNRVIARLLKIIPRATISEREFTRVGLVITAQNIQERLPFGSRIQSLPEEILEVGDKIVVLVHFQAWPKGGGQMREGRIADVYTVQDGKIIQMQAYRDSEEARKAVGLSPHH